MPEKKYILSAGIKYRRERFGCVLMNTKCKEIDFFNRSSAYIIESFINPCEINEVNFSEIPRASDFLLTLIKKNIIVETEQDSPTEAELFHINTLNFPDSHLLTPLGIEIELTRKCMRQCSYCAYDSHPNYDTSGELTLNEWKHVIESSSRSGIFLIRFTGGDPFTRKDATDIMKIADNCGMQITIGSDLTIMTEKIASKLSKLKNLHILQTSLDGPTAEIADSFRGKGSHRQLLKGLSILNKFEIPFMVGMVLTQKNKKHLIETARYAENLGAKHFVYTPIYKAGRSKNISDVELSDIDIADAEKNYFSWITKHSCNKRPSIDESYVICDPEMIRTLDRYLRIDPYGNIYPSIQVFDAIGEESILGSIKQYSVIDIWRNSKKIERIRKIKARKSLSGNLIPLNNIVEEVMQNEPKIRKESRI